VCWGLNGVFSFFSDNLHQKDKQQAAFLEEKMALRQQLGLTEAPPASDHLENEVESKPLGQEALKVIQVCSQSTA